MLAEITIARLHADLEAVRIAELYAEHPLLRTMPVPRFRMPEVELDVPVVINEIDKPEPIDSEHEAPTPNDLRRLFEKILDIQLKNDGIEINASVRRKLKLALDSTVLTLTKPPEIQIDMSRMAIEFSKTAMKALPESISPKKRTEFEEKLKAATQIEFLKYRILPPRVNTLITTAQVKEAGPGEVVTRLRLKVVEESFEWTSIEAEGEKQDRLVIE